MKVDAYRCDFCGCICEADEIRGIIPVADMFDNQKSFPATDKISTTSVHHCIECSRSQVIIKAEYECPRKRDERSYQLKFSELYYLLRHTCVENVRNRKKFVK